MVIETLNRHKLALDDHDATGNSSKIYMGMQIQREDWLVIASHILTEWRGIKPKDDTESHHETTKHGLG